MASRPSLCVEALFAYPIKSCAPIELEHAALTRDGIPFDRNWVIVRADEADKGRGRFLTQRDTPRLALVRPSLPPQAFLGASSWGRDLGTGAALTITVPGEGKTVSVPISGEVLEGEDQRKTRKVSVWDYDGVAVDEGDEAADLLSDFLGRPVRLVRHAPGVSIGGVGEQGTTTTTSRLVGGGWTRASSPNAEVAFADAFPLLITTVPSTRAVSRALGKDVEAVRFRPNIVVGGGDSSLAAWQEDTWASISIGKRDSSSSSSPSSPSASSVPVLDLVKPCDRCTIPHVNPATGERDAPGITRVLRENVDEGNDGGGGGCGRTGARLGWLALPSWKSAVFFGWNATVRDREGRAERGEVLCFARVGDEVTVVEERKGGGGGGGVEGPS